MVSDTPGVGAGSACGVFVKAEGANRAASPPNVVILLVRHPTAAAAATDVPAPPSATASTVFADAAGPGDVSPAAAAFARLACAALAAAGVGVGVREVAPEGSALGRAIAAAACDTATVGVLVPLPVPAVCLPCLRTIPPHLDLDGAAGPHPAPAPIAELRSGSGEEASPMPGVGRHIVIPRCVVGTAAAAAAALVQLVFRPDRDVVAVVGYRGRVGSGIGTCSHTLRPPWLPL